MQMTVGRGIGGKELHRLQRESIMVLADLLIAVHEATELELIARQSTQYSFNSMRYFRQLTQNRRKIYWKECNNLSI